MISFKQNNEITYDDKDLMEENTFIGAEVEKKTDFVGWTGLIPISIMFEYVFGIKPDAANNKITWHVNLLEKHGIEKYPFGTDGELTLICEERSSPDEKPSVTVKSNVPVTVEIIWGDNKETVEI